MKAQSSIEFMTMVGLFMVIFLAFFAVLGDKMVSFNTKKQAELADDMLYFVESEIFMAAEAHDGYSHNFSLPAKLAGQDYNLTLNASGEYAELTIKYLEFEYARPMLVNMSKDSYLIKPGFAENRVQRKGDLVHVNS